MRHRVAGKHLNRTASHRRAMRRNMAGSLIEHGAIRTTEAKAKDLRRFVDRLITIAGKGSLHARRQVIRLLGERRIPDEDADPGDWKTVVQKLFDEIAPRYVDRPGGYTRIIHLSERRIGDAGRQVLLQLIEGEAQEAGEAAAATSRRKRRAAKRHEAAAQAVGEAPEEEAPAAADEQAAPEEAEQPAGKGGAESDDAPAGSQTEPEEKDEKR